MARVLVLASRAKRSAADIALLRTAIVSGCALALILAKAPLGF